MGRKPIGHRAKKWAIKTHPDLSAEALASRHEVSSAEIKRAYDAIDKVTQQVARILDKYGILANLRILYRAYAEELWKLKDKYTGVTFKNASNAIATKYLAYNCDESILRDIARLFGLEITFLIDPNAHLRQHYHDLPEDGSPISLIGTPELSFGTLKAGWAYHAVIAGIWQRHQDASAYLDGYTQNTGTHALNDEIQYKFNHRAGDFTFNFLTYTGPLMGIVTVSIDGVSQGTIDCYALAGSFNNIKTLPVTIVGNDVHTINFKVTGKNPASADYYYHIVCFWFGD